MNTLARKYFQASSHFCEVRILTEESLPKWDDLQVEALSDLPRGWFELSQISSQDRIEFIKDYWMRLLPFQVRAYPRISQFFDKMGEISVVLKKESADDIFSAELVYSLADESTFFRGLPPPTDAEVMELKREVGILFPRDYLGFMQMHNGFGKLSEVGVLKVEEVAEARRRVIDLLLNLEEPLMSGSQRVDIGSLIPFFESMGLSSFQCFYTDWYPGSEMGNVYLSGIDCKISDISDSKSWEENLAFPTFSDWLSSYLEGMTFS